MYTPNVRTALRAGATVNRMIRPTTTQNRVLWGIPVVLTRHILETMKQQGRMIADIEMEHIRQDQDRDVYEQVESVRKEIVAELLAAGDNYVTEEQELHCN